MLASDTPAIVAPRDSREHARDGFGARPARTIMRTVFVALVVLFVACDSEPVGRVCDLGGPVPATGEVVVASPALDCVTRTCLRVPPSSESTGAEPLGASQGLCTAACESDDECEGVPESPCRTGFTCGVPPGITVGPFCCQKMCVCRDNIAGGELLEPKACDPENPANTCQNLPGR